MENKLNELVTDALAQRFKVSGLTEDRKQILVASIMVTVQNRVSTKLMNSLQEADIKELESRPEEARDKALADLAKKMGMESWVSEELDTVMSEIAQKTSR